MSMAVTELTGFVCDLCRTDRHASRVLEAGDYEYGVPGRWGLARCAACGLYYQAPRPAAAEIPAFYPPSYAVYGDDPVVGWLFKITYWLDARRVAGLIGPTTSMRRERSTAGRCRASPPRPARRAGKDRASPS